MYTVYCANQPKAMEVLDRLGRNQTFKNFTDQCMANPACRGLTLFSFLIKPIQRICKYPLLLKVWNKFCFQVLFIIHLLIMLLRIY